MPNRPFFNFSGDQIQQVSDENQDNLEVLKQVLVELQRRSTPKMKALRSKVEEKIAGLTGSVSGTKTEPPPKSNLPKHALRQSQPLKPAQKSMFGDEYKPHGKTKRNARSSAVKAEAKDSASSNNKEIKEETPREPRMGKMRKPGKLDKVPVKRQFDLKDEVKLEVRKDAPLVERYEAGVKALVAEMRYKKTAAEEQW